jgi:RTX calcium-binding nonapeptide repeat (4 copies)
MRRIALLIGMLAPFLAVGPARSGPAESTCILHPQHARLEVTVVGYPNVLARSGDELELNGSSCDGATVFNTDLVDATAQLGGQFQATLSIGMIDGPFSPGATVGSEIPIHVDFTQTPSADLSLSTGAGAQHIVIDGNDIDLDGSDGDPRPDILVSDPDECGPDCSQQFTIDTGRDADHVLQPRDDSGTLGSILFVRSGGGDDVVHVQHALVTAGKGDDVLQTHQSSTMFGQWGDDLLIGSSSPEGLYGDDGKDLIYGRGGNDELEGFEGRDIIVGGGGRDEISGEDYGDWIWGGRGPDRVDGGGGYDHCQRDRRDISRENCEERLDEPPPAV